MRTREGFPGWAGASLQVSPAERFPVFAVTRTRRMADDHSPSTQDSSRACPDLLFRHVDMLAGVIGPRYPGNRGTMAATAGYIEGQLKALGLTVARETYDINGESVHNLVVNIPGTHLPNDIVILGAHYDSTPTTPGADDNGSAVAVLIETARLLKDIIPRRSIRFVAFACEESPYFHTGEMGSMIHAQGCVERRENVVAMLCLEMVGYFVDGENSQQVPPAIPKWLRRLFPSRGNFLAAVANPRSWKLCWQFRRGFKKATRFPLFSIVLPERIPEIHLSDHRSFWQHGFPALMLTDTSFLRNPNYHQWTDTADTLDYNRMAQVTLGVVSAVRRISGASGS